MGCGSSIPEGVSGQHCNSHHRPAQLYLSFLAVDGPLHCLSMLSTLALLLLPRAVMISADLSGPHTVRPDILLPRRMGDNEANSRFNILLCLCVCPLDGMTQVSRVHGGGGLSCTVKRCVEYKTALLHLSLPLLAPTSSTFDT